MADGYADRHDFAIINEDARTVRGRNRVEAERSGLPPSWHFHLVALLDSASAAEVLRPIADSGNLYGLANYLAYPHFDPRPFPELMSVLLRELVAVGEPVALPFACEAG